VVAERLAQAARLARALAGKAMGSGSGSNGDADPSDSAVVKRAAQAAEDLVFSRLAHEDVRDLDVSVSFEAGVLEVDVYLNAPEAAESEATVADDAALAARAAADELLE
jgi:hypothetical protein